MKKKVKQKKICNLLFVESEPPRDVTLAESNELGEIYNASCALQWLTPCNSNGILKHFLLVVTRTSLEDPTDIFTEKEEIPFDPKEDFYYAIIWNLLPLNTYEFSLTPIAEDNETEIMGQSYTTKYESPDGCMLASYRLTSDNLQHKLISQGRLLR